MDKERILALRNTLREFERQNEWQNSQHCCNGITLAQCHTIMEIGIQQKIKLTELAEKLNLDKSTVSRSINGLVNIGLVNRIIPESNRRSTIISLTENGNKLFKKINQENNTFYAKALQKIPLEHQDNFLHLFSLFVEGLQQNKKQQC